MPWSTYFTGWFHQWTAFNTNSSPSVQKCVWVCLHFQLIFLVEKPSYGLGRAKTQSFQFIPNVSCYVMLLWYKCCFNTLLKYYSIKWQYEGWHKFIFFSVYTWIWNNSRVCGFLSSTENLMIQFKFSLLCCRIFGRKVASVKIYRNSTISLFYSDRHIHTHIFSRFFLWVLVFWQWPSGSFSSICVGLTHFSPRPRPTVPCPKHMCSGRGISEPSPHGTCRHTLQIWHWTLLSCLSASHSICQNQYWPRGFTP